jgi:hypothetical protein
MKRLTTEDVKQNIVLQAIARGVGIYSPHTACDNCLGGGRPAAHIFSTVLQLLTFGIAVNDWLAGGLGKGSCKAIVPNQVPPEGNTYHSEIEIREFTRLTGISGFQDRKDVEVVGCSPMMNQLLCLQ